MQPQFFNFGFRKIFFRYNFKIVRFEIRNSFAEVAQLVERNLAKVEVAGSSLVFRSKFHPDRVEFLV